MTQREEFEEWFDDNIKNFPFGSEAERNAYKRYADIVWQAAKATSFNLPDRMDYELHGDTVISNPFADGYNQCLSEVISLVEEAESKSEHN